MLPADVGQKAVKGVQCRRGDLQKRPQEHPPIGRMAAIIAYMHSLLSQTLVKDDVKSAYLVRSCLRMSVRSLWKVSNAVKGNL